ASVEPFGAGWDNTAYLVDATWVFRFPRREVAVAWLEREVTLLPAVAPRVSLPVPIPERRGQPTERFPWPFAAYRLPPGRPADVAVLSEEERARGAEPLAQFLVTLHAFPADQAARRGAGPDEIRRLDVAWRAPKARANLAELGRL